MVATVDPRGNRVDVQSLILRLRPINRLDWLQRIEDLISELAQDHDHTISTGKNIIVTYIDALIDVRNNLNDR